MQLALHPYVTTGVAIVGATVMVMAPIQVTPRNMAVPAISVSTVAVAPASAVSDLIETVLNDFNVVSVAGGHSAQILINKLASTPAGLAIITQAARNNPQLIPQLISFLAYGFLNPAATPVPGLPAEFAPVVFSLAQLFPAPIGPGVHPMTDPGLILSAFGLVGKGLTAALELLPTIDLAVLGPALGQASADLPAFVTDLTTAFLEVVASVGTGIGGYPVAGAPTGVAGWLGITPSVLFTTLKAATADPSQIPGLFSYLVYSAIAAPSALFPPGPFPSSYSLFVSALAPTITAWEAVLPPPIGGPTGAITKASEFLNDIITQGLDILPTPVNPFLLAVPTANKISAPKAVPPTIPGDTTPVAIVAAVKEATDILAASGKELPLRVQNLVGSYLTDPATLPAGVVGLGKYAIDGVQAAARPITYVAIGTLPTPLRAPAVKFTNDANLAVDNIQSAVTKLVTPKKAPALHSAKSNDAKTTPSAAKPVQKVKAALKKATDSFNADRAAKKAERKAARVARAATATDG